MHAQLLKAKKAKVPVVRSRPAEEVPKREEKPATEEIEMFGTEL